MMKAVRFHGYAGLPGIRLEEVPQPTPASGEILVRVLAAGVNPFDWYAVEGWVNAYVTFTLPAILGRDFSGMVEAIGAGVSRFAPGDAVYGHVDAGADGSFADYVAVPAARAAPKPAVISHIEAASLPNVLMAAWNGLFSPITADLKATDTILIHGAAGGIGSLAVQLARYRGARVIGTGSAGNLAFIERLGADLAVDYTSPGWIDRLPAINAVLDTASGADAALLCAKLGRGGRYIALRGLPPEPWRERQTAAGVHCAVASGPASEADFPAMARLVADGIIRPVVSGVMPLAEARAALAQVSGGHVRGKLVLNNGAGLAAGR